MTLSSHIKNIISHTGPISISEFMQLALSHPLYGYYQAKEPFGTKGDFTTSPEISQMFGEMIGAWSAHIWQQMGCLQDVVIVEMGPGRGTLMADFLRSTAKIPGFHNSISIAMVETSKRLQELQRNNIGNMHPRISWYEDVKSLPQKPIIVIANELFDALPIRQYIKQNGKWHEKMLGVDKNGELAFTLSPEIKMEGKLIENAPENGVVEICPQGGAIIKELVERVKMHNGAVLIIDYGYIETQYKDTLDAIGGHQHRNILEDIGALDISAHVDFQALKKAADTAGVRVFGPTTQGSFLQKLGIGMRAEMLCKNASDEQKHEIKTALARLVGNSPEEMGELFKVISFTTGNIVPEGF